MGFTLKDNAKLIHQGKISLFLMRKLKISTLIPPIFNFSVWCFQNSYIFVPRTKWKLISWIWKRKRWMKTSLRIKEDPKWTENKKNRIVMFEKHLKAKQNNNNWTEDLFIFFLLFFLFLFVSNMNNSSQNLQLWYLAERLTLKLLRDRSKFEIKLSFPLFSNL